MNNLPTVFHVTHIKSGSQWVAEVLKHSAPERVVLPQPRLGHVLNNPIRPGGVYPTVYLARPHFDAVLATMAHPHRTVVVLRDIRDTLVSLYFSLKVSHAITNAYQHRLRERLCSMDEEAGLRLLIDQEAEGALIEKLLALSVVDLYDWLSKSETPVGLVMAQVAGIQQSWLQADALCIRYEDLVADEYAAFERIIDYCQIDVSREHLHNIIRYNTFEAVTGRRPGQEDPSAHQRKGIVGDWRNHFTDRVKAQFKRTFGEVLIETGYEQDLDW